MRRCLSPQLLLALMVGSMVPDFGYFVRQFGVASFAHTMVGAVAVSIPVGWLVYVVAARVFRPVGIPGKRYWWTESLDCGRPLPLSVTQPAAEGAGRGSGISTVRCATPAAGCHSPKAAAGCAQSKGR